MICIAENVLGDSFGKVLDYHVIINVKKGILTVLYVLEFVVSL